MEILIQNRQRFLKVNKRILKKVAEKILEDLQYHEAELSILLTDNEEIRFLNRRYLNKDKPTNVLSFTQGQGIKNKKEPILGDVVISVEKAIEESKKVGMEPLNYLVFLLIHGILHLAGYNHEDSSDRKKSRIMMHKQRYLMKKIQDLLNTRC